MKTITERGKEIFLQSSYMGPERALGEALNEYQASIEKRLTALREVTEALIEQMPTNAAARHCIAASLRRSWQEEDAGRPEGSEG